VSVQSLSSGSSGNGFLIEHAGRRVLLDCGVGIRVLTRSLAARGCSLNDLDAVLLTHEHSDHIRTLPRLAGTDVPVVATAGTKRYLPIPDRQWEPITPGGSVTVAGMTVWAIAVDHDASEPCGFLVDTGTHRLSIFTDLGCWHERLAEPIRASDLVVLEANHDAEMLRRGPYPIHLKRRVASSVGHLSNEECGRALAATLGRGAATPEIWLAHLSASNNTAKIAQGTVARSLQEAGIDAPVTPLPRTAAGPVWQGVRDGHPARREQVAPATQLALEF
jgi:phosphoribosyl 1,2-cyclic phosphodiesterase